MLFVPGVREDNMRNIFFALGFFHNIPYTHIHSKYMFHFQDLPYDSSFQSVHIFLIPDWCNISKPDQYLHHKYNIPFGFPGFDVQRYVADLLIRILDIAHILFPIVHHTI